jgi:hypothetical protein
VDWMAPSAGVRLAPHSVRRSPDDLSETTFPLVAASELPSRRRSTEFAQAHMRWKFRQDYRDPHCPQCDVPAGSACRTRAGKTAAKYHTARFILVPSLRDELTAPVPADRGPGKKWTQGPEVAPAKPETNGTPIRIGYARCSTATQELQSQLDALAAAHCTRVFSEKISTRIKIRPELEKALTLAHEIKTAAPDQPVVLTVHEMKRLARNAAELMTLSPTTTPDQQLRELIAPFARIPAVPRVRPRCPRSRPRSRSGRVCARRCRGLAPLIGHPLGALTPGPPRRAPRHHIGPSASFHPTGPLAVKVLSTLALHIL